MRIKIKAGKSEIEVEDDAHDFNDIDKNQEHPYRLATQIVEELIERCTHLEQVRRKNEIKIYVEEKE